MKLRGPVVSALIHVAVLGAIVFFVNVDPARHLANAEFFFMEAPEKTAPAPANEEPAPRRPARPRSAAPAATAPGPAPISPAAAAAAGSVPASAMDLDLVLGGDGDIPEGAVVLSAPSGSGGAPTQTSGGTVVAAQRPQRAHAECDEELAPPEPVARVEPEYPADAPAVAGRLRVQVHVSPGGEVTRVEVVEGVESSVDRAIHDTLALWRFRAARRCGRDVAGVYTVVLNLELME